jgi:Apea-like HEPN
LTQKSNINKTKNSFDGNFRTALIAAVTAAAARIDSSTPVDIQKSYQYEAGAISHKVVPGFGIHSKLSLMRWIRDESPEFEPFQSQGSLAQNFPTWIATCFGGSAIQPDTFVAHLAQVVAESNGEISAVGVVKAFTSALLSGHVRMRITAHLKNHAPVPQNFNVTLSNGVVFRCLSDAELETVLKVDIWDSPKLDPFSNRSVLEYDFETELLLSPMQAPPPDPWPKLVSPIEEVHTALHCYLPGSTPIELFRLRSLNPGIPVGGISTGRHHSYFSNYDLTNVRPRTLSSFVKKCIKPCRPNLELAKNRLRDAENRSSALDAIIDAFVGIEALLNSENTPEITTRVALNYASLSPKTVRQSNYRKLKDLYKVRSNIVHGKFKPGTSYKIDGVPHEINEAAVASKALLRELVRWFVSADDLREHADIDTKFWEGRYFSARK